MSKLSDSILAFIQRRCALGFWICRMLGIVYARQVENRKISRDLADRELSRMRAVLKTLEALK